MATICITPRRPGPAPAHVATITRMVSDYRRRFWISCLDVPVLATSEMVQHFLGLPERLGIPGDRT